MHLSVFLYIDRLMEMMDLGNVKEIFSLLCETYDLMGAAEKTGINDTAWARKHKTFLNYYYLTADLATHGHLHLFVYTNLAVTVWEMTRTVWLKLVIHLYKWNSSHGNEHRLPGPKGAGGLCERKYIPFIRKILHSLFYTENMPSLHLFTSAHGYIRLSENCHIW